MINLYYSIYLVVCININRIIRDLTLIPRAHYIYTTNLVHHKFWLYRTCLMRRIYMDYTYDDNAQIFSSSFKISNKTKERKKKFQRIMMMRCFEIFLSLVITLVRSDPNTESTDPKKIYIYNFEVDMTDLNILYYHHISKHHLFFFVIFIEIIFEYISNVWLIDLLNSKTTYNKRRRRLQLIFERERDRWRLND